MTSRRPATRSRAARARPAVAPDEDDVLAPLTLRRLVEQLGSPVIDVVVAPRGLDVPVGHAAIHDPLETPRFEPHDVVLAVGVSATSAAAVELLDAAAKTGATAVLLKVNDRLSELLEATAHRAGVAVLAVTPQVTWSQLHTLVRSVIASGREEPEAADGSVPLGDLFALANAVAAMVGGPTTIEDPKSRVLAYSSQTEIDEARRQTILGRRVPDEWIEVLRERGVFRRLWSSTDVILVDDLAPEVRPRMAIAIRAGDEILGSIWVAQGDAPFDEDAERALRRAADIAALHVVRSRAQDDVERRVRGEQLQAILDGRGPLDVLAARLGVELDGRFAVLAFELQTHDDAEVVLQRARAVDLVSLYCEAYRRRAVSVAVGNTIYTLVPSIEHEPAGEGLRRLAHGIAERAEESLSVAVRVGIGSEVDGLREVTRSRSDADQVLRVLARAPGAAIAAIDDVRAQATLLELEDVVRDRPHLLVGQVDLLSAHDAKHGTDYIPTLRAYFDAFGDVPTAAARLAVHPNTFRYRLRRLCEVGALDLDDPDQRLAAELQLRLR